MDCGCHSGLKWAIYYSCIAMAGCTWVLTHPKQDLEIIEDLIKDAEEIVQEIEK